jgi:5,6-dimethylbenzimidazole synthase
VGWVSILDNDELRAILGIPKPVVPVAYLCIGYAQDFLDEPELQRRGWAHGLALDRVIYRERWEGDGLGAS